MKYLMRTCVVTFLTAAFMSPAPSWAEIEKATLQVDGLSCPFCSLGLEKRLKKVPAIDTIQIHMKQGLTEIKPKSGKKLDLSQLHKAVKDAGFTLRDVVLTVTGTIVPQEEMLVLQSTGDGTRFLLFDSKHAQSESKQARAPVALGAKLEQQLKEAQQTHATVRIEGRVHEHAGLPPGLLIQKLEMNPSKGS